MTPEDYLNHSAHAQDLAHQAFPKAMRDALLAVLKIHSTMPIWRGSGRQCVGCYQGAPCPTRTAITEALGLDEKENER